MNLCDNALEIKQSRHFEREWGGFCWEMLHAEVVHALHLRHDFRLVHLRSAQIKDVILTRWITTNKTQICIGNFF